MRASVHEGMCVCVCMCMFVCVFECIFVGFIVQSAHLNVDPSHKQP